MTSTEFGSQHLKSIGQVVATLQAEFPDVTHSSLRFLEREGFISAIRTQGGHRLYSPADVETIVQIKTWQRQRLTLDQIRARLADLERLPDPAAIAQAYVESAIKGDFAAAAAIITNADEVGLSLLTMFGEVLTPALHEIGRRWEAGTLAVAQEKEISELSRELIVELTRRHAAVDAAGPVIVAGCVAGERHELGLRMICGLLRATGYRVHFLGADVGQEFLLQAVALRAPEIVLLSARLTSNLPALEAAVAALKLIAGPKPSFEIIVGGNLAELHAEVIEQTGATPVHDRHPSTALDLIDDSIARRRAANVTARSQR